MSELLHTQPSTISPTARPVAVAFEHVTKQYGDTVALHDVSIQIPIGQTVALLGPNGAGKSTSINLTLGLLDPTGGSVRTLGLRPREAIATGRVGALLQTSGLPVTARVGELVAFVRRLYPEPLAMQAILARSGLKDLERRPVETLSGGEAQRLRFAMAIAGDPELVFLDEPTVGMDVETRRAFWRDIRAFVAEGRTVLFATHYLDEADDAAERIVVLDHGRVVADGSARSIKARVSDRVVGFTLPTASPEVVAAIKAIPGVSGVDVAGERLAVATKDADAVIEQLFARGLRIRDLEIQGAGLEDAFIALTSSADPAA
ncbi:MAG TPA: ABC transporter ATP-binding protein [Candidatus Limnocylindrales bacterium]|nr:ABC transporter ATP-binding protein [Candidatus Limnocylindrales bacterium]